MNSLRSASAAGLLLVVCQATSASPATGVACGMFQALYNIGLKASNQPAGTYKYTCGKTGSQRLNASVTDLHNGTVLIAGGQFGTRMGIGHGYTEPEFDPQSSAELYDVIAGRFLPVTVTVSAVDNVTGPPDPTVGSMLYARGSHAAIRLPNRKVLLIGGGPSWVNGASKHPELYNPQTHQFEAAGPTLAPRYNNDAAAFGASNFRTGLMFTATALTDGRVLVAGATDAGLPTAEIYDPQSNTFTATGPMMFERFGGAAVLLRSGKVLLTGGALKPNFAATDLAEIYDPATGTFSYAATMTKRRASPTATLLQDGRVLIASDDSAEIYSPSANVFVAAGPVSNLSGPAVALPSGKVLFPAVGKIYDAASNSFSTTASLLPADVGGGPFRGPNAALLENGQVLVVGGGADGQTIGTQGTPVSGQLYQP